MRSIIKVKEYAHNSEAQAWRGQVGTEAGRRGWGRAWTMLRAGILFLNRLCRADKRFWSRRIMHTIECTEWVKGGVCRGRWDGLGKRRSGEEG